MPAESSSTSVFSTKGLVGFILAIALLYFAKGVLLPFALALLFAFLLSPAANRLERWQVPRVLSVMIVILTAGGILGSISWLVSRELIAVVENAPTYKTNIDRKIQDLERRGNGLGRAVQTFRELGDSVEEKTPRRPKEPMPVRIVQRSDTIQAIRDVLGPLLGPIEQTGLVLIFVLFILLDRHELRNRLVKLTGQEQIHTTTQAMDDAATRVSRYVAVQCLINFSFGLVVGLGLYFAGIPSALLWGVLAAFFRFVPYLGVLVAGSLPILVALGSFDGWRAPLTVTAIFAGTELITGNVIEPLLLGSHTGLSSIAILLSALFWATIWGPVGLILSTPLTVCLSVLGRYIPELRFLDILLGDEPALRPDEVFYQRLIALDHAGAFAVLESELKTRSVADVYDSVVIPALVMAKRDRHNGALDPQKQEFLMENVGECVSEVIELSAVARDRSEPSAGTHRVLAVPSSDGTDEILAGMFAQLAERSGYPAMAVPLTDSPIEILQGLAPAKGDVIYIAAAPPLALRKARQLSAEINAAFPQVGLIVGLWGNPRRLSRSWDRVRASFRGNVSVQLQDSLEKIPVVGTAVASLTSWRS